MGKHLDYGLLIWNNLWRGLEGMERGGYLPCARFLAAIIADRREKKNVSDSLDAPPFHNFPVLGGQPLFTKIQTHMVIPHHILLRLPIENVVRMNYIRANPVPTVWDNPALPRRDSPIAHLETHLGEFPEMHPPQRHRSQRGPHIPRPSSQKDTPIETRPSPRTSRNPASHLSPSQQGGTSSKGHPHTPSGGAKATPDVEKVTQSPRVTHRESVHTSQPSSPINSQHDARPNEDSPRGDESASHSTPHAEDRTEARPEGITTSGQGTSGRPIEAIPITTSLGPSISGLDQHIGQTVQTGGSGSQLQVASVQDINDQLLRLFHSHGIAQVMTLAQEFSINTIHQLEQQCLDQQSLQSSLLVSQILQQTELHKSFVLSHALVKDNRAQAARIKELEEEVQTLSKENADQKARLAVKDTPDALVDILEYIKAPVAPPPPPPVVQASPDLTSMKTLVEEFIKTSSANFNMLSSSIKDLSKVVATSASPDAAKGEKKRQRVADPTESSKRRKDKHVATDDIPTSKSVIDPFADPTASEEEDLNRAIDESLRDLENPTSGTGQSSSALVVYEKPEWVTEEGLDMGAEEPSRNMVRHPLQALQRRVHNSTQLNVLVKYDPAINTYEAYNAKFLKWVQTFKCPRDVWSSSDVKKVDQCKIRSFEKVIKFLECRITRMDDSVWILNDADFPDLHPNDWKDIILMIGGRISQGHKVPEADRAIYGRMKVLLKEYLEQFQEDNIEFLQHWKIPLREEHRPSPVPENIYNHLPGVVLMDPEPGLVYSTTLRKVTRKFFFRFSEINKYRSEELIQFKSLLDDERWERTFEVKQAVQKARADIEYHLGYRNNLLEMADVLNDHFRPM